MKEPQSTTVDIAEVLSQAHTAPDVLAAAVSADEVAKRLGISPEQVVTLSRAGFARAEEELQLRAGWHDEPAVVEDIKALYRGRTLASLLVARRSGRRESHRGRAGHRRCARRATADPGEPEPALALAAPTRAPYRVAVA